VADTQEWFQALATDADVARVQAHLDKLIAQMVTTAAVLGQSDALEQGPDPPEPRRVLANARRQ
jgi:hypothetical protein